MVTLARMNIWKEPNRLSPIVRTMEEGTQVAVLDPTPQNEYLEVELGKDRGWANSEFLKPLSAAEPPAPTPVEATTDDPGETPSSPDAPSVDDPAESTGQIESCKASFYDEGQQTADGEQFDPMAMTAAHKTLPFNTQVRVTNTANGQSVDVRINDRGPFVAGRCIDLAKGAFLRIASESDGVADVTVEVLR
jgi:rare lipoprotein A (peptidoglycan hydrolase)